MGQRRTDKVEEDQVRKETEDITKREDEREEDGTAARRHSWEMA